jgi:hypothetical protein
MGEEWRDIPGYEGMYEVSNTGKVRSMGYGRVRELTPSPQNNGYLHVTLCKSRAKKGMLVHALVALAFIGSRPNKMQINHKNGNKHDNRVENLEYVTSKENIRHACETGLMNNKGENNGCAKLSKSDAENIRLEYGKGKVTQYQLAKKYGVSQSLVYQIINRKIWS